MADLHAGDAGFWRWAGTHPDAIAVIDDAGITTTHGELRSSARRLANGLREAGVANGDGIAMVMPNDTAFFTVVLAAMELGLHITPVNTHLAAPEVAYVLADCDAQVVIGHEDLAAVCAAAVRDSVPADRRFCVGSIAGFRPVTDLFADDDREPADRAAGQLMMYTSGTTGHPKGVRRDLATGDPDDVFGKAAVVMCTGFGIPLAEGTHLVCGPLYHAAPYVGALSSLHVGKTVVLMDHWTPERFLELVERHAVDSTQMVPTMFNRLLALPESDRARYDVSSLRSVFHTGAPCPEAVKRAIMDWWGPVVYETYGGTEGAATIATPRRWAERPGTVGKAIQGVTVHILDDDGEELPSGETGNIWIESSQTEPTYYKDADKTREMRNGRRFTLGDIGYLDDEGYLFLRDRRIDMIISGGVNIYPAEVEAALLGAPGVADAVVIGVPDDDWGERVKAIIELRPEHATDDRARDDIVGHCAAHIARYKLPREIEFVDVLPRLPNGKVEKRRLRDAHWADRRAAI